MKPLRHCLRAVAITAACLLLAACGAGQAHLTGHSGDASHLTSHSGDASHPTGHSVDASSGASDEQSGNVGSKGLTPTRAQALAFARAVNLNVRDIPEASVEAKRTHRSDASAGREAHTCEKLKGWGHLHTIAEASSPKLRRGQELEVEQITSSVSVLSDEQAVARQFALLSSPALRECAARALTRSLDDASIRNARWGRVTVSKLPVSTTGTAAKVGIRIEAALNLSFSEVSVPIYVDVFGFSLGRAEVALTAMSATQPVPAATEQELLLLLLARARAQRL